MDIQHDADRLRFFVALNGVEAFLAYRPVYGATLDYVSTFVPPEYRRAGLGGAIVRHALDYARREGYRIVSSCWFVRQVIQEHPEYQDLVAE